MIKQLFFVRNTERLIISLIYTTIIMSFLYTVLTLHATELYKEGLILLVNPLISLTISFLMIKSCRKIESQQKRYLNLGCNCIITLLMLYFELDCLNVLRGLVVRTVGISILTIILGLAFLCYQTIKINKEKGI